MDFIPEVLNGVEGYVGPGAERQMGLVDVDLPAIEYKTVELNGAGILGDINAPVLGHTQPMEMVLRFRSVSPGWLGALISTAQLVTLMGSIQGINPATGLHGSWPLVVAATGLLKARRPGQLKVGQTMSSEMAMEVTRYVMTIDGVVVVLIDKLNYIHSIDGVDVLTTVKSNIGLGSASV